MRRVSLGGMRNLLILVGLALVLLVVNFAQYGVWCALIALASGLGVFGTCATFGLRWRIDSKSKV